MSARRALTTHVGSNLKLSMHQSRGGQRRVQAAASLSHVHDKGSSVLSLISTSESGILLEGRSVMDAGGGFRVVGSATVRRVHAPRPSALASPRLPTHHPRQSLLSLLAYQALARGVLGVPRILWLYSLTGGWHYRYGLQREVQVVAALRGNEASLRVELSRGKHSLALPIVLAPHASIKHTLGAALATAAAGWILRALRGRKRRRDAVGCADQAADCSAPLRSPSPPPRPTRALRRPRQRAAKEACRGAPPARPRDSGGTGPAAHDAATGAASAEGGGGAGGPRGPGGHLRCRRRPRRG